MAKFCTNCGASLDDDKKFCTECGASVNNAPAEETAPAPVDTPPSSQPPQPAAQQRTVTATMPPPAYAQPSTPAYGVDTPPPPGSKYEMIGTGGFIGIMLLMCIPIVGQILMIVWACGGCRKLQKRNLARASLIMFIIGLIISLLIGFAVKALINKAVDYIEQETGTDISGIMSGSKSEDSSGLSGLLGIMGGLAGDGNSGVTNSDIEELEELEELLGGLGALTGEDGQENGLGDLIEGAQEANRDAEAINDGWPSTLREYPGGTATAVASYRTEISGTTKEEMLAWIEDLKKDGFEYQDFYDFGMSEEEMLDYGWWAYDGKTYLSVSYSDGTVIVDHTKELPDLESYFN